MKSTPLSNVFNSVSVNKPDTSTFDLTHDLKTSLKMGNLVPVLCTEIIPGDSMTISSEGLYRLAPMLAPIMHRVNVTIHHFFVPNRLVWKNWETYIAGGSITQEGTPPLFPVVDLEATPLQVVPSFLANYLGLPVNEDAANPGTYFDLDTGDLNAIPFAAYQRIWYDWYRDENLQLAGNDPDFCQLRDGVQLVGLNSTLFTLRRRAWEHDYFTSSLPFAQKGAPVDLPIDITGRSTVYLNPTTNPSGDFQTWVGVAPVGAGDPVIRQKTADSHVQGLTNTSAAQDVLLNPNQTMFVNADSPTDPRGGMALTGTINDLRTAMQLQKWLELNARAGSRYIEYLQAHFNVRSSDYRLQRAQYLGGTKSSLAISEVLQTSQTDTTPQGNMAGHGVSYAPGGFTQCRFEEHGTMISILSITPVTAYYQGIPKLFRKTSDRYQFATPLLAQIGEQPVKNEELVYVSGNPLGTNDDTFGYLPMYSEYRYLPARISGQMATTLDYWHLGRKFDNTVSQSLSEQFIVCEPDRRIFAVTDPNDDEIYAHILHKITINRRLPYYGSPGGM